MSPASPALVGLYQILKSILPVRGPGAAGSASSCGLRWWGGESPLGTLLHSVAVSPQLPAGRSHFAGKGAWLRGERGWRGPRVAPANLRTGPLSPSPGRRAASSSLPRGRKGLVVQEHAAWQVGACGSARALPPSWPSERPLPPSQPQLPTGAAAVPGPALGSVRPWGCGIEASRGTNVPGPGRPRRGHQAPHPHVLSPRGPVGSTGRWGREATGSHLPGELGPRPAAFPGGLLPRSERHDLIGKPFRKGAAEPLGVGVEWSFPRALLAASGARPGRASRLRVSACRATAGRAAGFCQLFGVTGPGGSRQAAGHWPQGWLATWRVEEGFQEPEPKDWTGGEAGPKLVAEALVSPHPAPLPPSSRPPPPMAPRSSGHE